jgi:S-adenosylmethionine hydrolase
MKPSIITLLTDFGTRDHYVASMKGVILSINPRCTLVDITHRVSAYDVREAALLLASAYAYFPDGTVHLCVVDPGVGSPRKPILMMAGNHFFVGPDNGLFTLVAWRGKTKRVVMLTQSRFFLPSISSTFHGRDIFAPVAAHLSLGVRPEAFGSKIEDWVKLSHECHRGGAFRVYARRSLLDSSGEEDDQEGQQRLLGGKTVGAHGPDWKRRVLGDFHPGRERPGSPEAEKGRQDPDRD